MKFRLFLTLVPLTWGCTFDARPVGSRTNMVAGALPTTDQNDVRVKSSVVLLDAESNMFCGGVLLAPDKVLTAASCVYDQESIQVGYGQNVDALVDLVKVTGKKIHPDFRPQDELPPDAPLAHNLAVLKLERSVRGGTVKANLHKGTLRTGDEIWLSGYGSTDQEATDLGVLRIATARVRSLEEGNKTFSVRGNNGEMGCEGDVGSPAFVESDGRLVVAGIISYGFDEACDVLSYATDVSRYASWLEDAPPPPPAGPTPPQPPPAGGGNRIDLATVPMPPDAQWTWCYPPAFGYNPETKLCESQTSAFGPFSAKMIDRCINEYGAGNSCYEMIWNKDLARALRGTGKCPDGSQWEEGLCVDGQGNAFGPFPASAVRKCLEQNRSVACLGTRWAEGVARVLTGTLLPPSPPGGGDGGEPTPPPSANRIISMAANYLGYAYWWGGAAYPTSNPRGADKGTCRFINGRNDFRGHGGKWGGDCSGYASKVWELPEAMPMERQLHPFSTWDFMKSDHQRWFAVNRSEAKMGDAFVYNTGGGGHIVIFEKWDSWGRAVVYESKGCKYGSVYNPKTLNSSYKARRRKN